MFRKRRISRFFAFVMVVTMAFLAITPAFAQTQTTTFRDVPATHFAYEAINWVSDPANGAIMVGDASNNFRPSATVNKFEAAQIFAMAAGFRHITFNLPPEEQAVFTRSMDTWRSFLNDLASEYSSWNRTVDREIAFLLYNEIILPDEVQEFVTQVGQTEVRANLTRQQALEWTARLVYGAYVQEVDMPTASFTRAEMAAMFFHALAPTPADEPEAAETSGSPATISGTITYVHRDTHVTIASAAGTEVFPISQNAVVMVDNVQRSPAFLREGMTTTVLVDSSRSIISLVARSAVANTTATNVTETPPATAVSSENNGQTFTDEGFVTAVTGNSVTIRIQRVRISGQIIDEERTFTLAPGAVITRGGVAETFAGIQVDDIAFFSAAGSEITTLDLVERERTILGILTELRQPDIFGGPVLVVEETNGASYELRVQPASEISRGQVANLNWDDLRIGDAITAEVEFDRVVRIHAVGERSNVDGRLNEIRITERYTEITVAFADGTTSSFIVRAGVFDVYTLRIGMQLRISLDSREVVSIQVLANQAANIAVSGYIQSVRADNTIVVVEGQGANARTHTITVPANTTITRGVQALTFEGLRVNMNVHVVLTAPGANTARTITILQ